MSTQVNQYLMWGIRIPYDNGDDFYTKHERFICDSAYEGIVHEDGIFCAFDGRDGRFIIIGRVIAKAKEGELLGENAPIPISDLTEIEQEFVRNSVQRNFGLSGEFHHWFFTLLR